MVKIGLEDLIKVLSFNVVKYQACTEILFAIDNDEKYKDCWMGKMPNRNDRSKELYWYGLAADGSEAYDYNNLEDILDVKVFRGKSLREIIGDMTLIEIDSCDPEWRLPQYLDRDMECVLHRSET